VDVEQSIEAVIKFLTTRVKKEKRMAMVRQFIEALLDNGVSELISVDESIDLVKRLAEKRNKIQNQLKKIQEEKVRDGGGGGGGGCCGKGDGRQ